MDDIKLFYQKVLDFGIEWSVTSVDLSEKAKRVDVQIAYVLNEGPCSETGEVCKIYDMRQQRSWRHLDCIGYTTYIHCRLPRVKNSFGKIVTMSVQWAESGESHTIAFENQCIKVPEATHNRLKAAQLMNVSEDKICGVMHAAVNRGLQRRNLDKTPVGQLCIDEKSVGKGQQYISILSDGQTGAVLDVVPGRDIKSVEALIDKVFTTKQLAAIKQTCCDMWEAYMNTLKKSVLKPNWYMTSST